MAGWGARPLVSTAEKCEAWKAVKALQTLVLAFK
ncbi:hypothetical protein AK812_SmicGene48447, partial [Symbiodinium microadriaticum]